MSDLDTAALGLVALAVASTAVLVLLHRLRHRADRAHSGSRSPAEVRRNGP